jgi:hypothetical protein
MQFLLWESGLSNLLGSGEAGSLIINVEHVPILLLMPNLKPIETCFSKIKRRIREHEDEAVKNPVE